MAPPSNPRPTPVPKPSRDAYALLTLISAGLILWLTLPPGSGNQKGLSLQPFAETRRFVGLILRAEHSLDFNVLRHLLWHVGGNLLAFLPFGFGAAGWIRRRPGTAARWAAARWAVLAGLVFSLGIELGQLLIPYRATDIDDLIFNTLGAVSGAVVYLLWTARERT